MQYLTIWDWILAPVYILVLVYIAKNYRDKHYKRGSVFYKFYLPGLYVKFVGVFFIAIIYQFYYNGGDTFNFLTHSQIINSALDDSFTTWTKLLRHASVDNNPELYKYTSQMFWYNDASSYTVSCIGAVLGLLNGTSYIPIALLFAFFSYTGIWAMYKTFANIYPHLAKPLGYAFLFVPGTFFWGSAFFKDTVCMFGLGWMTYSTFRIFVQRDLSFKNLLLVIISFVLVATIKLYILLAFIPALSLWLMLTYSRRIQTVGLRWITNFIIMGGMIIGFLFLSQRFAEELNRYSLDNLIKTAETTKGWISYVSERDEGSKYDLGTYDPSITGVLSKFPAAVNVTLYRPYLWEARKPIMLLSAFESVIFLGLTLFVFFKLGIFKTFRFIFTDANLLFFFVYSLIFAFAVGLSTGNFGSLSRYKIPCVPFFAALLIVLYYHAKPALVKKTTEFKHAKRPVHHFS